MTATESDGGASAVTGATIVPASPITDH